MKNVIILLWGAIIASSWWAFGIQFYHNGLPDDSVGLGIAFGFLIVMSLVTAIYILAKVIGCIHRCWDN